MSHGPLLPRVAAACGLRRMRVRCAHFGHFGQARIAFRGRMDSCRMELSHARDARTHVTVTLSHGPMSHGPLPLPRVAAACEALSGCMP